ncbi:Os03g0259001 [Oryza sativa Japonica Group]|uniref:Os03g0259001 protein n=1 Tax=Oryza sativa subsp. japonica TaxID=39947 RepID=A0A0P0VVN6_ORYSJ|nr:Os03g0259001 [Oryza sativa Japonica Group]
MVMLLGKKKKLTYHYSVSSCGQSLIPVHEQELTDACMVVGVGVTCQISCSDWLHFLANASGCCICMYRFLCVKD